MSTLVLLKNATRFNEICASTRQYGIGVRAVDLDDQRGTAEKHMHVFDFTRLLIEGERHRRSLWRSLSWQFDLLIPTHCPQNELTSFS